MKKIVVQYGQSVWDIAIQYYGSADGVYYLMLDNSLNLNDNVIAGTKLNIRENTYINKAIVDYYNKKTLVPATGDTTPGHTLLGPFSIGFSSGFSMLPSSSLSLIL